MSCLMSAPSKSHYGGIFGSLWFSLIQILRENYEENKVCKNPQLRQKLRDKIAAAIFHITSLCRERDLRNQQVKRFNEFYFKTTEKEF